MRDGSTHENRELFLSEPLRSACEIQEKRGGFLFCLADMICHDPYPVTKTAAFFLERAHPLPVGSMREPLRPPLLFFGREFFATEIIPRRAYNEHQHIYP
jgi:hypothetical protein